MIPLLHIGEERTTIADAALALGWRSITRDHFRHDRPSPLEIENAIALAAGVAQGAETRLALEAVEQMFTRLAAGARSLPAGNEFSATLLILRELMHHLGFSSILLDA